MKARLFRTKKNEIVLVFQNANEGWQFCIFRFLTNGTLEFITASKVNLTSEIIKHITGIFGKQKYAQSTCPTTAFINLVVEEDVSTLLLKTSVGIYKYDDTDIKKKTLKKYVSDFANNDELLMEDIEMQKFKGLPKRKLDDAYSKAVWASPFLDQNNLGEYDSGVSDELYKIKLKNKKFQFILDYIEFKNPINKYKNILLSGPAGNGKTTNAEAVAKHYNLPYAALVCDPRMEAEAVGGVITVKADDKGNSQWIQSMTAFLKVIKAGGVGSLEEISLAPGATQSAWNAMLNGSVRYIVWQGETHFINENTIFFATRNIGYEGNANMNFSFKDRFLKMFIPMPPKEEIVEYLMTMFKTTDVATKTYVDFCFKLDQYLEDHHKNDDMYSNERPEITLRMLNEVLAIFLNYGEVETPLTEVLRGIFDSPSYTDSTVANVVNVFKKDIDALEKVLFVNDSSLSEADDMMTKVTSLQHSPASTSGGTSSADRKTRNLTDLVKQYANQADSSADTATQAANVFKSFKRTIDKEDE